VRYRVPVLAATVAALSIFTAGPALAVVVPGAVDQQQADNSSEAIGWGGVLLGQSFTVGHEGSLTGVSVDVNAYTAPTSTSATLSIFAVDGSGLPTGSALASHQATAGNGSVAFVFASPPAVTVGEKLAITLSWDAGESLTWRGTCGAGYSGGGPLVNEGSGWETFAAYLSNHKLSGESYCLQDFTFATYVLAPAGTPPPAGTLPPTNTTQPVDDSGPGGAPLVVFAFFALGAAAVVVRRATQTKR
jgi:hypothetical protein